MIDCDKDLGWKNAVSAVACNMRENKESCLHPEWWWFRDEARYLRNMPEMPPGSSKCLLCTQEQLQTAESENETQVNMLLETIGEHGDTIKKLKAELSQSKEMRADLRRALDLAADEITRLSRALTAAIMEGGE